MDTVGAVLDLTSVALPFLSSSNDAGNGGLREAPKTLQLQQPLGTHPDTTLRRLGIIRQTARYRRWKNALRGAPVEYDPIHGWVYSEGYPRRKVEAAFDPFTAGDREDTPPAGVIWIVGDVAPSVMDPAARDQDADATEDGSFEQLEQMLLFMRQQAEADQQTARKASEQRKAAREHSTTDRRPNNIEFEHPDVTRARERFSHLTGLLSKVRTVRRDCKVEPGGSEPAKSSFSASSAAGGGGDVGGGADASAQAVIANLGGVESDSRFLSDAEVKNSVRQYFFRSLPNAARRSQALIVTSARGAIAEVLGSGIGAVNEQTDIRALRVAPMTDFVTERTGLSEASPNGGSKGVPPSQTGFTHLLGLVDAPSATATADAAAAADGASDGATSNGKVVRRRDVTRTVECLVQCLADGVLPNGATQLTLVPERELRKPPPRAKVPVVVVVAGGDEAEVLVQLQIAVKREWPIFLVQGSGGAADALAAKVRDAIGRSEISEEARRQFCGLMDAATAQIVSHGRCVIVPRGEVVDTFTQSVIYSLRGDETLRRAWIKLESWREAAEYHARWYKAFMLIILALGLLATGLSVFLTLAQILWTEETQPQHSRGGGTNFSSGIATMYDLMNLVVIFLPIAMQLVQTISNRQNNGVKWAALRYASESARREVYLLRSEMGDYAKSAVLAAKRRKEAHAARRAAAAAGPGSAGGGGAAVDGSGATGTVDVGAITSGAAIGSASATAGDNGGSAAKGPPGTAPPSAAASAGAGAAKDGAAGAPKDGGAELYATRQELLHIRVEALTVELAELISDASIPEYEGPVPHPGSVHPRDDGFTDITADEYADLRLAVALEAYSERARTASGHRQRLDFSVHVLNTLGTLLGALATYELAADYNIQAWVAFTTAFVSALSRYDHWLMIEWSKSKYTQTALNLGTVVSWWASRGSLSGQPHVRNELPLRVEGIIAAEVGEFRKQLMTSAEAASKAADEMASVQKEAEEAAALAAGLTKEQREARQRCREMAVGGLTVANIEEALRDPGGIAAKKIKRLMKDLNAELGDVIGKATEAARLAEAAIEHGPAVVASFDKVRELVTDPSGCLAIPARLGLFNFAKFMPGPVLDLISAQHKRAQFLRAAGTRLLEVSNLRQIDFLDMARNVDSKALEQFEAMPMRLQLEAVRSLCRQETLAGFVESLAAARLSIYEIVPVREQLPAAVEELQGLAAVPWRRLDHGTLISLVTSEPLRARLSVMPEPKLRALLKRVEYFFAKSGPLVDLAAGCTADAALLDLHNVILANRADRLAVVENVARLGGASVAVELLPAASLHRFFPATLQAHLGGVDRESLANMVRHLAQGMPMAYVLEGVLMRVREAETRARLQSILRSSVRLELFVLLADELSQRDVLKLNKQAILKRLMAFPSVDKAFVDDLRTISEAELKQLLSSYAAAVSRSYVGTLFDQLAEQMQTMETRTLLSYEEQLLLLQRLKEFRGADLAAFNKARILKIIGFSSICARFRDLYGYQLREMIQRLLASMNRIFTTRVLMDALDVAALAAKRRAFDGLSQLQIDRVVSELLVLRTEDVKSVTDSEDTLPPREVRRRMLHLIVDPDARAVLDAAAFTPAELSILVDEVGKRVPDRSAIAMFNLVVSDLVDDVTIGLIDYKMHAPHWRNEFFQLLERLFASSDFSWFAVSRMGTQTLVRLFAHLGQLVEADNALRDPNRIVEGEGTLHERLHGALKDEPYATFMLCAMENVTVNTPLVVFGAISSMIADFSLPGLVQGVGARALLLPMVLDMMDGAWWGEGGSSTGGGGGGATGVAMSMSSDSPLVGGLLAPAGGRRRVRVLQAARRPRIELVRQFIDDLPSLYDPLVRSLRLLGDRNLELLMRTSVDFCAHSPIVHAFRAIRAQEERHGMGRLEMQQVRLVAAMLEASIVARPFDVRRLFGDFDHSAFASKSVDERFATLSKLVAWEALAQSASRWTEMTFRLLFDLIKAKPIFNTRGTDDSPGLADAAAHLRLISERSKQMAALGALGRLRDIRDRGLQRAGGPVDVARVEERVAEAALKLKRPLASKWAVPSSTTQPAAASAPAASAGDDDAPQPLQPRAAVSLGGDAGGGVKFSAGIGISLGGTRKPAAASTPASSSATPVKAAATGAVRVTAATPQQAPPSSAPPDPEWRVEAPRFDPNVPEYDDAEDDDSGNVGEGQV